ncbi:MAG: type VI secretion system baseplate subunit TssF [Proteobacteria bacterium]|nr:type VI secretion system baseplate subunit TssF [Pseudomonadota bacterium]MBU6424705.1 type VI secretion system baseplate subunit TssF [Rhodospirillales bacterium]
MADSLLPYFNQELTAIRQLAAEFAQAHPKIAGRLRMSPDTVDDPHVARLLDGVAFLSARAQARLDDEFPELTDTLLNILYPHYLAPFPSCAVTQFIAKPDLAAQVDIAPGFEVETEAVRGQSCRYRTTSHLTLWPVKLESARLTGLPFTAPVNNLANGAVAVLRLVLTTLNPEVKFSQLGMDKLRFFLRGGPAALRLYELMVAHTLGVALADTPNDIAPVLLPKTAIQEVGFAPEEALLPWPARSFEGFRLLSEYFAFPQKFMFLDIAGLGAKTLVQESNKLEIFLYLKHTSSELERTVDADMFALGCTPIVNLFPQRCEPVALDHTTTEYRVLPDARRSSVTEIWQVNSATEVRQDSTTRPFNPFYRLSRDDAPVSGQTGSYLVTRRDGPASLGGTDCFISLFDTGFDPEAKLDSVLSVEALCLNRDLPSDLPFGGSRPALKALQPHTGVASMACVTPPTPTLRPERRARGAWRLISHLSLGHLSVTGGAEGAAALKEILRLYDLRDTADTRAAVEALLSVKARPGTARVPGARLGAFCRGLDVELEFDQRAYQGSGLYLLAAVLARFLALHASINSFVRTSVRLRGKPEEEVRFPPRAGAKVLL